MLILKKALAKTVEGVSLVRLLDKRLAGTEIARSHKLLHISMLTREDGFCPREFALLDVTKKSQRNNYVATAQRVAYDTGHALEDLLRNKWLEYDVVGNWKCVVCGSIVEFSKKPKHACQNCKNELWAYKETRFTDAPSQASGSVDLLVDFGLGKHTLVEAKTIDKDEFADLKAPYAEHRIRTQLYLRAVERSKHAHAGKIDTDSALVFYISKGYGKKNLETNRITPFKEYRVEADRKMTDELMKRGEALAQFRAGGKMPAGICPTSFVTRVKSCPVVKECWSGQFPAGK